MSAGERKFAPVTLDDVDTDGVFTGYASLFGEADMAGDVVDPGAFAASLKQRGAAGIRLLFQHDPAEPIGVWETIQEDARGLFVRGRIMDDVARGRDVLSLMRAGGVDGLSIGFKTVKARRDAATGHRHLTEVDLWEISVVTFPLLPSARIGEVKRAGDKPTARQLERWLVRDAGLTRSEARTLIAKGYRALDGARDAAETHDNQRMATAIRRAARAFHI